MTINTHYDILNVARNASSDEIRAAYTKLTQKYVSDSMPSVEATKLMKVIHNSYAILSNPIQKSKYDQWLLEQESVASELKKAGNDNQVIRVAEYRDNIYELKVTENAKSSLIQNKAPDTPDSMPISELGAVPAAETPVKKPKRRLAFAVISLTAILAVAWIYTQDSTTESANTETPLANDDGLDLVRPNNDNATGDLVANGVTLATPKSPNDLLPDAAIIPAHDSVTIDKFIGKWKGVNDVTPIQQSLDISLKTENTFVFRLDSKIGNSIGGIYGIAVFENSYAHFYNKEYGCSIIFTSKSNAIQVSTSSCQSFYRDGAVFDGSYMKPEAIRKIAKPTKPASKTANPEPTKTISSKPQQESTPAATPKPAPQRLRNYVVTVKDAEGNESTIELLAKDKDAARDIIRDFRGNPKVLKIREKKK